MIYEKALSAPAFRRRSVRRRFSLFSEKSGAIASYGSHVAEAEEGIVCAEGAEEVAALPEGGRLCATEGHFRHLFVYADGVLSKGEETYPLAAPPLALFAYAGTSGETEYFALCADACVQLGAEESLPLGVGGTCGAIHGERLFLADGSRLSWSKPLDPAVQTIETQGAGHTDLPSADGGVLALVSYRETLFLFRERGVWAVKAPGDTLAFRAERLPFEAEIAAGTVRSCGDKVLFLTRDGLCALSGEKCERLTGVGFSAVDEVTSTAACAGKYYAAVRESGKPAVWCVDPARGKGHLIRAEAEQLAGAERLFFAAQGKQWALTPRGMPRAGRQECVLKTEPSLLGLSSRNKFLDGITLEGKGHFRVEARGECGLPRAVSGRAGEKLLFPYPVRGNCFSLDIRTLEEGACVRAAVFDLREEVPVW